MYYREHPLNINIDRLGKCYFDIKSKLDFKSDDKSLIDFNAICVNRIPDDEKSITGGNVKLCTFIYIGVRSPKDLQSTYSINNRMDSHTKRKVKTCIIMFFLFYLVLQCTIS